MNISEMLGLSSSRFIISLNYISNIAITFSVVEWPLLNKDRPSIEFFGPSDLPFGLTFGQWTVRWWEWALSIPIFQSPILDNFGENANINQCGDVWFLAGTFGENRYPQRKCVVPTGKYLLFPVINYEMNALENPELENDLDLVSHVTRDMDDIINKIVVVDGVKIPIFRIPSVPQIFPLFISDENYFGIRGGVTRAAADGYWVFLKPLPPGNHEIFFHGSCSGGIRNSTAKYYLTIS